MSDRDVKLDRFKRALLKALDKESEALQEAERWHAVASNLRAEIAGIEKGPDLSDILRDVK